MITSLRTLEVPGWVALQISGRIDAFNDRQLIQSMEQVIGEASRVAIDLSGADFLSLQVLKFLSGLNQNLGRKGGELALVRPTHNVRRQIEIFLGMRLFHVYQSMQDLQVGYHVQPRAEFHNLPAEMLSL